MIKQEIIYLYLYLVKKNKIVEVMQAMLHRLPKSIVFTHAGLGFSNMLQYLSAEWEKVKWMPNPTEKEFPRGMEVYKVPVTYAQMVRIRRLMDQYVNAPYDKYFYALWALRLMPVYVPIMMVLAGIVSMNFFFAFLFILGVLYIPVSKWLKNKSKKSWACSMLTAMILEMGGDIKFGVNKEWSSITPVILRMLVRFSGWQRINKTNQGGGV